MEFDKVCGLIAEKMNIDPEEITMDTSFEDIQIDSLDMVEIVMDLEEEFDISIDANEPLKTVGELVEYIENNRN